MKTRYKFNYFTGYGYREISSHTIKHYPIEINTEHEQEAIDKCIKRASKLVRFNDCYRRETVIPVIKYFNNYKEHINGMFFISEKVIKWEGDKIYWSPQIYTNIQYIQSFNLQHHEYASVSNDYTEIATKHIYPSLVGWFNYVWERMNGNKTYSSTRDTRTQDLQNYFFNEIQDCIKSGKFLKENEKLQELYNSHLSKL